MYAQHTKKVEHTDRFQEECVIVEIVLDERYCATTLGSRSLYDNIKRPLCGTGVLYSLADPR